MAKWTVAEPEISGGRCFYLRRDSEYFMSFREDLGWTREDVQFLADRRNAREAKPRFGVVCYPFSYPARYEVWDGLDSKMAMFYGINAEQHAEDFANKLNKECGQ